MAAEQIIVDIPEDGDITIKVENAEGAKCEQLTKEIEDALGSVRNRKHKPEYYRKATSQQQLKQK